MTYETRKSLTRCRPEPNGVYPEYLCFPMYLLKHLSLEACTLLAYINRELNVRVDEHESYLMNLEDEEDPEPPVPRFNDDGWMPISVKEVLRDVGMSAEMQSKYMKELAKWRLIEISRRGIPAKRWIRLACIPEEVFRPDDTEDE